MEGKTPYTDLIQQTALRFGIDEHLLEAQVIVESSGHADAFRFEAGFFSRYVVGRTQPYAALGPLAACSYGLLQIIYVTAYEIGFRGRPEELFVPEAGLHWGATKLRALVDWAHGDMEQALCAYNGGKGMNYVRPYANQIYADKVFKERERA